MTILYSREVRDHWGANKGEETGLLLLLLLVVVLMLGCGGGRSTGPVPAPPYLPGPGTGTGSGTGGSNNGPDNGGDSTAVLVNLSGFDSVPDHIVSFELKIESVTLHSSEKNISLLDGQFTPRSFEFTRQSLTLEPLFFGKVPRNRYSGITIIVSNPTIVFMDASGILHSVPASLTSDTQVINIPFDVGSAPMFFDLTLLGDSVSFGEGDVVKVAPHFAVFGPWKVQNSVGTVNGLVGRVTSVGPGSFGVSVGRDYPCCFPGAVEDFAFAINSNTEFHGVAGLDVLKEDMTVEVDAGFYADGSLLASKVKLLSNLPSAVVFEGITLNAAPSQFKLLIRDIQEPYEVFGAPDGGIVNVADSTQFHVDAEDVDLKNLNFSPIFDALTMAPGQNVRATAASAANAANPDQVRLEQQEIEGVAADLTAGSVPYQYSFPLRFGADSALARITGADSVLVVVQPSTYLDTGDPLAACVSCIPGKRVRARGLLFYSGGQYQLVASEISTN